MPDLDTAEVEEFKKWQATKATKKVKSNAKRLALADLKKAHKSEYEASVKKYEG